MLYELEENTDFLAFKNGDEIGYKNLFRRFYRPLCLFALQYSITKEEAEEIVQDVLLQLYYKSEDFDTISKLSSFLYVCTRNATINLLDKKKRTFRNQADFFTTLSVDLTDADQYKQIAYVETVDLLHRSFQKLPKQCAKIMTMLYLEGLTVEEVVDKLNITASTVYVQKKKGVDMLKTMLDLENYTVLALFLSILFES